MMKLNTLLKLKAQAPDAILKTLISTVEREKGSDNPKLPLLRVSFAGGGYASGYLIDFDEREQMLLLAHIAEEKPELMYIRSSILQAVEVLQANDWLHELSDGVIPFEPAPGDVLTGIKLKALLREESAVLSSSVGESITLKLNLPEDASPADRYYATCLIDDTVTVLTSICKDKFGKAALAEAVTTVSIIPGHENKTSLSGSNLELYFNIERGLKRKFNAKELLESIEKLL
ncbi:hypothetical protein LVD17_03265 [Fulvivirga ulvae]|uniref:hypothetical protein n=1 Tax=Fulvivirga ulvae TaxID=2904245 RepID=UPI001F294F99|nr:hypothetical protein [Fulvivirga ulvae]UII32850.1 hypothetical protein LVD17_03265 [Fulvivirga ulvae]